MDLSGHHRFHAANAGLLPRDDRSRAQIGESLLAMAWAALASARAEAVDIHLQGGQTIAHALALRVDGRLAEASCRAGHWTHGFAVEDVVMVRHIPRGGALD